MGKILRLVSNNKAAKRKIDPEVIRSMRGTMRLIDQGRIVGVGVVTVFQDGSTGTFFDGTHIEILGALARLEHRIHRTDWDDD